MSESQNVADGELLEFLGSVDGEGEGWSEYLEDSDLRRAAANAPATPPTTPPAAPSPASPPVRPPQQGSQP